MAISVVLPVYKGCKSIEELHDRLVKTLSSLTDKKIDTTGSIRPFF